MHSRSLSELLRHNTYIQCLKSIEFYEQERLFCKHNMNHFLDVARIAYIMVLEDRTEIVQEDIYLAALLHDIGRHEQYKTGEAHEVASARIAAPILEELNISEHRIHNILEAILNHRNSFIKDNNDLSGYIYRADKTSRACFSCKSESSCNWSIEKKNLNITY